MYLFFFTFVLKGKCQETHALQWAGEYWCPVNISCILILILHIDNSYQLMDKRDNIDFVVLS